MVKTMKTTILSLSLSLFLSLSPTLSLISGLSIGQARSLLAPNDGDGVPVFGLTPSAEPTTNREDALITLLTLKMGKMESDQRQFQNEVRQRLETIERQNSQKMTNVGSASVENNSEKIAQLQQDIAKISVTVQKLRHPTRPWAYLYDEFSSPNPMFTFNQIRQEVPDCLTLNTTIVDAIDTMGTCVVMYKEKGCKGQSKIFQTTGRVSVGPIFQTTGRVSAGPIFQTTGGVSAGSKFQTTGRVSGDSILQTIGRVSAGSKFQTISEDSVSSRFQTIGGVSAGPDMDNQNWSVGPCTTDDDIEEVTTPTTTPTTTTDTTPTIDYSFLATFRRLDTDRPSSQVTLEPSTALLYDEVGDARPVYTFNAASRPNPACLTFDSTLVDELDTRGTCVLLYTDGACSGRSKMFQTLGRVTVGSDMDNNNLSIGPCSRDDQNPISTTAPVATTMTTATVIPSDQIPEAYLYNRLLNTPLYIYNENRESSPACWTFPNYLGGVPSIDTRGSCVAIYSSARCEGPSKHYLSLAGSTIRMDVDILSSPPRSIGPCYGLADLYKKLHGKGGFQVYDSRLNGTCHNVAGPVASVNTHDTCVNVYSQNDCGGTVKTVKPGTPSHYDILDYTKWITRSIGPCTPRPMYTNMRTTNPPIPSGTTEEYYVTPESPVTTASTLPLIIEDDDQPAVIDSEDLISNRTSVIGNNNYAYSYMDIVQIMTTDKITTTTTPKMTTTDDLTMLIDSSNMDIDDHDRASILEAEPADDFVGSLATSSDD